MLYLMFGAESFGLVSSKSWSPSTARTRPRKFCSTHDGWSGCSTFYLCATTTPTVVLRRVQGVLIAPITADHEKKVCHLSFRIVSDQPLSVTYSNIPTTLSPPSWGYFSATILRVSTPTLTLYFVVTCATERNRLWNTKKFWRTVTCRVPDLTHCYLRESYKNLTYCLLLRRSGTSTTINR